MLLLGGLLLRLVLGRPTKQVLLAILVAAYGKAGPYTNSTIPPGTNMTTAAAKSNTGGWCWIRNQSTVGETALWELVGGKFVELVSTLLVCPIMYLLTVRNLAEIRASRRSMSDSLDKLNDESHARITEFGRKLHAVPIIFLFTRLWGTVNEAVILFGVAESQLLKYATAIFDPSQGFWNGLMCVLRVWCRVGGVVCSARFLKVHVCSSS